MSCSQHTIILFVFKCQLLLLSYIHAEYTVFNFIFYTALYLCFSEVVKKPLNIFKYKSALSFSPCLSYLTFSSTVNPCVIYNWSIYSVLHFTIGTCSFSIIPFALGFPMGLFLVHTHFLFLLYFFGGDAKKNWVFITPRFCLLFQSSLSEALD